MLGQRFYRPSAIESISERVAPEYTEMKDILMTNKPLNLAALRARRADILALADKYGVYNVRVFGSLARGEATNQSDVDKAGYIW
jgi:hypothetical protein